MANSVGTLFGCEKGNTLMVAAAVMPMLVGAGAISIDVTQWALAKRQLQRTADSAALAGARALQWERSAIDAAERDLKLNNKVPLASTPIIENAPTQGNYKDDMQAVRVHLTTAPKLTFISYFMTDSTEISAEATAAVTPDPKYCLLALDKTSANAVKFSGNSALKFDCAIGSNSQGNPAIYAEGSSTILASGIGAVGVVPASSNYISPTVVRQYQPPVEDPFADLPPANSFATNCKPGIVVEANVTAILKPGCYTGMTLKGSVTLRPGTYVINSADLLMESQAVVVGERVTIILTGSTPSNVAKVKVAGGASIVLTPSTSGQFKQMLMYQDSRAEYGDNYVTGNSSSLVEGAFYFPKQAFHFSGTGSIDARCMRVVALQLRFGGASEVGTNCPNTGASRLYGTQARLVA